MSDFFKRVKKAGVPVALAGKEEGSFFTGFIREADEEFVLLEAVSAAGRPDGWLCIRNEEISRADAATEYLEMMAKVFLRNGEKNVPIKVVSRDVLGSFIDQAIKNKWLCTVEVGFESLDKLTGYFVDRDFDRVEMHLMGGNGKRDGFTTFDFEEIVLITAAGEREKYLEKVIEILREERAGDDADEIFSAEEKRSAKKSRREGKERLREAGEKNGDVPAEEKGEKNGRVLSFPKKDD